MYLNGIEHKVLMKNTSDSENRSDLIQGGGRSQVPCLKIESTSGEIEWMYESDDIIRYLRQVET